MTQSTLIQQCLQLLQHPQTKELSIDSPETTILRWQIIREKPYLFKIYQGWYESIASAIPDNTNPVLEIGSGAGFMAHHVNRLITSDILQLPNIDTVVDACAQLPFENESLRGIAMVNTLHHLPDVEAFLQEAERCVEPDGVVAMVEPWVTTWSSFVYNRLHHEPFEPNAKSWKFDSTGPLSSANGALPWIVFQRDRKRFENQFPTFRVEKIRLLMPFTYLLSGGVSMRCLVPNSSFQLCKFVEQTLTPIFPLAAMFALIVVRKVRQ